MELLSFVGALVIGALANLMIKANLKIDYPVSRIYIYLAITLAACYWVFYFSGLKNDTLLAGFNLILDCGKYLAPFLLGFLITRAAWSGWRPTPLADTRYTAHLTTNALTGLAILTGNIFLIATVGKLENMHNMTSFFVSSGYSVKFLYFIMAAESLGAIGILLDFKLKTGAVAAAGLICIMIGAVYTHWHNHDPFSDSYAAVIELINLSLLEVLYYLKLKMKHKLNAPYAA